MYLVDPMVNLFIVTKLLKTSFGLKRNSRRESENVTITRKLKGKNGQEGQGKKKPRWTDQVAQRNERKVFEMTGITKKITQEREA